MGRADISQKLRQRVAVVLARILLHFFRQHKTFNYDFRERNAFRPVADRPGYLYPFFADGTCYIQLVEAQRTGRVRETCRDINRRIKANIDCNR